jgi:hypothetical protein
MTTQQENMTMANVRSALCDAAEAIDDALHVLPDVNTVPEPAATAVAELAGALTRVLAVLVEQAE